MTTAPLKPGRRGIAGELSLYVPDKLKYASQIENIKFHELIVNTTDKPLTYGVLGVEIINKDSGEKIFHTSFSGDRIIGAKCKGPRDTCGGEVIDQFRIQKAGNYSLALAICHATMDDCLGGRGDWETLTPGIDIVVDNWRPPG